jgi:hypothetical protein
MRGNYSTIYIRKEFPITDAEKISALVLTTDYSDAYIAYINGVEVARSNVASDGLAVPFDALATSGHLITGALQTYIDLQAFPGLLKNGPHNVLAIQGVNTRITDRDFVLSRISLNGVAIPEPAAWTLAVVAACLLILRPLFIKPLSDR